MADVTAPSGDGREALRVACPKCKAAPGEPCTTGGYLPVGDLDGDERPDGPHRQRKRRAAAPDPEAAAPQDEVEREHFAQVARDTFAELKVIIAERDDLAARLAAAERDNELLRINLRSEAESWKTLLADVSAERDEANARLAAAEGALNGLTSDLAAILRALYDDDIPDTIHIDMVRRVARAKGHVDDLRAALGPEATTPPS